MIFGNWLWPLRRRNAAPIRALFDQVWVMSLPASAERRHHIVEHLPAMGLHDFRFFDATPADDPTVARAQASGEVATFPPCFRCGGLDCGKPDCNNFLTPAQIACFLSYRRLWRTIAEAAAERVLVVEDDVWLHPHTHRVLSWVGEEVAAERLPFAVGRDCLLRLGWARCEDHAAGDASCRADATLKMSNPCHALTRGYARALVARDQGIRHTADVYQHQLAPRPGEAFSVFPPIASELSWSEGRFASNIHPKGVHIDYLRAKGEEAAAAAAVQGVATHVKKKHFRPLLITGHPRCGTGYAAALCRQLGLDVGHERLGSDGISSWMFAVEAEHNPYALDAVSRTRQAFGWRHLVMPVRDLAQAAGSVMRDSQYAPPSYAFRREHILLHLGVDLDSFATPLERAVRSLTGWARIVLAQDPDLIFRIEDEHERLREFLIRHGLIDATHRDTPLDTRPINADKPYKGVCQPKPAVAPADWRELPADTQAEVTWYCQRFGYAPPWCPMRRDELTRQFLEPAGWLRSKAEQAPVRGDGTPLPWFTYGAIEFLHEVVRSEDRVFEYGAGYSTLWWQGRVAQVESVEHDAAWCERLRPRLAPHVQLEARPIDSPVGLAARERVAGFFERPRGTEWPYDAAKVIRRGLEDERFIAYATRLDEVDPAGEGFDFIVVDGMARRLCTWVALTHLKPDGFLILDNSNRSDYDLAYTLLDEAGFRQIPCWGLVPGADFLTNTSLFTRSMVRLPRATFSGNSFQLPEP